MEQLTRKILDTLANLGNSQHTALISVEDTNKGVLVAGLSNTKFIALNKHITFKGTPLEKIAISRQIQPFPATFIESALFPAYEKTANLNCLCLPLLNGYFKLLGIALLSQDTHVNLSHDRLQTLTIITGLFAAILEERNRLAELATTDQLTKLYTRNYFERRLQEEVMRVRRHGGVISLILSEIDNFEQIKEMCGYQQGTKILKETAELIHASIRKEIDIACRYSSKHFIILLPNTDVDGAYVLAERIRQRFERRQFTTLQGIPIKVTMSIGISHNVDIPHGEESNEHSVQFNEISKEELMHRADLMLQAAKQAGCNQIMVWW